MRGKLWRIFERDRNAVGFNQSQVLAVGAQFEIGMEFRPVRIRPIFMSTLTSVFGMLPLVMLPGAGSELYRGLGSVVVGGLSVSALLTLLVIPPMMAIVVGPLENRRTRQAE